MQCAGRLLRVSRHIKRILELLARFEFRRLVGRDFDRFPGLRIAPLAPLAMRSRRSRSSDLITGLPIPIQLAVAAANATVAPPPLPFSSVGRDTTKSLTVKIKNTAKTGVLTGNVGTVPPPFSVVADSGPFSLSAGTEENVEVQFAPTTTGPASATLVITTDDPQHPSVNVNLTGMGVAGTLLVPPLVTFLPTTVATSSTRTLTIRNLGMGILHGNVGASTGPFAVTAGSGGFTLNDGGTQNVTIQFSPLATGAAVGTLSIASDDPKHLSVNVNLKGTGK
jgi:hypothetical protein